MELSPQIHSGNSFEADIKSAVISFFIPWLFFIHYRMKLLIGGEMIRSPLAYTYDFVEVDIKMRGAKFFRCMATPYGFVFFAVSEKLPTIFNVIIGHNVTKNMFDNQYIKGISALYEYGGKYYMIAAMVNNKGGVGKTVCSVNAAAALANRKMRVLLIDNDPQCNATSLLLGDRTPENTLYEMFTQGTPVRKCIYPTEFGVDILPNAQITSQIEADLYQDTAKSYTLLRDMVREYAVENYDFTLIDCVPSLGLWVIQAMAAADGIIVPIEAGSRFSLDGLASIYTSIESIRATKLNRELRFLKTLVNKVDLRTSSSKVVIEKIHELYPGYVFETTIPTNDAIKQAELKRTTVLKYDPQSSGAKRFRALADELIEMIRADRDQLELPHG